MPTRSIDRRVARTRGLLRQAMFKLTAEKGYAAVTVGDICREADVGRSTFYTHYPDKDCLRKATINEHLGAMRVRDDGRLPEKEAERFSFSGPAFKHADATREMHRAMIGGKRREIPEEIRDWISEQVRREVADIAGGDADAVKLEIATRFVTGAFFEIMHWWLDEGAGFSPAKVERVFQKLAFDGVKRAVNGPDLMP